MKTLTITNQYGSRKLEGKGKDVLTFLRKEAKFERRHSRLAIGASDNVHSINPFWHASELVTIASFEISRMPESKLIALLNAHGVQKFTVNEEL